MEIAKAFPNTFRGNGMTGARPRPMIRVYPRHEFMVEAMEDESNNDPARRANRENEAPHVISASKEKCIECKGPLVHARGITYICTNCGLTQEVEKKNPGDSFTDEEWFLESS
jgi:hypothetical protein